MKETRPLPKWLFRRYAVLWKAFKQEEFSFDQAVDILGDDPRVVSLCLSQLDRNGWIDSIEQNPEDSRKKVYKLTSLEKGVDIMAKTGAV